MTCLVTIFLSTNKYFDILMEFVRCSTQNKSFHFIGMRDFVRKTSSRSKGHHHHVDELVDYASVYVIIRQTEKIVIYSKLHRMMTTSNAECKKKTLLLMWRIFKIVGIALSSRTTTDDGRI